MIDLRDILLKIILLIVFAYFAVMLFCGCRTHKDTVIVKDSTEVIKTSMTHEKTKINDTSVIDENYIIYELNDERMPVAELLELYKKKDSVTVKSIKIGNKLKTSVVTNENEKSEEILNDSVKVSQTQEKHDEIKEKNNVRNIAVILVGVFAVFLFIQLKKM